MIRKTAIITGGFGDIGKAIATKFASNGYNVALTSYNTFDADFIKSLKEFGIEVFAMRCDQNKENDIINFVNSVFKEFEYVDVCVCCAGKAEPEGMLSHKETVVIDDIISTNLRGTILFNKAVLKHFEEQKHGNIVNIASIYGKTGGSLESVYSACKAGIIGLTKSLAVEVGPLVRVNCVAPGYIQTKMNNGYSAETVDYVKNQTPLARIGTSEDVASSVYFLASEEAGFITGETIVVSGGALRY